MARRVIFVDESGPFPDRERALWLDRHVAINCQDQVYSDSWSGDICIEEPDYIVGLPTRTFEGNHPTILEYGRVQNPDDVAWLRKAAYKDRMEGSVRVQEPEDLVARVHQLGIRRRNSRGFEIEVLSGEDARAILRQAKREGIIASAKEHWWLVPLGIAVLWFLFR